MLTLDRRICTRLKHGLHTMFAIGQRVGLDILPHHFYSSIPDLHELKNRDGWRQPLSMVGVGGAEIESQMQFLRECCQPPLRERLCQASIHKHACRENGETGYGPIEADFLFCLVATRKPRKIIQLGCGVSTAVILLAAQEAGYKPEMVCVDPFPNLYLKHVAARGLITLIAQQGQDVDLQELTNLGAGGLLFVDSTHAVRPGSEVNRLVLEALPRVKPGCFVHFHDIYFPYDYQPTVLSEIFFSAESTLLHAFLINNAQYSIAVSLSMLHHACPEELRSVLPNYRPSVMCDGLLAERDGAGHFPSATYLVARQI